MDFDFVIVGGGSAGCVLANRLSTDSTKSVCLIEAGPKDRSALIHIPLGFVFLFSHKRLNWRFLTAPQEQKSGKRVYIPRGKVLGGSSSINGMAYMRGHPTDYDEWAARGNPGWSFKDVLPYFLRSENNTVWRNSPFHGTDGPLSVSAPRSSSRANEAFLEAARLLQLPMCDDFNGPNPEGVGYRQLNQRNGRRHSAAAAFLEPVRARPNLHILTGAQADKVLFDGRRATGIRIRIDGSQQIIYAKREVILSAGSIGSPQILMRSGIGNAGELVPLGIAPIVELPGVGYNLQEHPLAGMSYVTASNEPYGVSLGALPGLIRTPFEYAFFGRGLFSSNTSETTSYLRTSANESRPDIQLSFSPARRGSKLDSEGRPKNPIVWGHGYGLAACLLHPRSRGTVRLSNADPQSPPIIDPRFFEDERDLQTLLRGFKLGRQLMNTEPFRRFRSTEISPGEPVQSDDDLRDYIRNTSSTAFHPVGTCAMGSGPDAVVDPNLSVRGTERLRVVDASIMPTIIGGNTNAPTIMIAEKASDMILGKPSLPAADIEMTT